MATIYGNAYSNTLKGTAFADALFGYGGDDVLFGFEGDDTLDGGAGADRMYGGSGNDTYETDSQSDRIFEASGGGIDTVRTSTHYTLPGYVENLAAADPLGTAALALIGNGQNNVITGNSGANVIVGGLGSDTLSGGAGNDNLRGGTGQDRLTGGSGADTFVFEDTQSRDTITDFTSGTDTIDLGWLMLASEFHFIGSAAFSGQAGQGRFANGLFQLDLNGDKYADLTINILGGTVSAGDFDFAGTGYWDY